MRASVLVFLCLARHICLGSVVPFDADWRFFKGQAEGAEQLEFSDAAWQQVNLPHDWSIAGPFDESNPAGGAGAFLPSGVAWYRKHFTLPEDQSARRFLVEFDGVMANSDVWINGHHLSHRPSGYVSFIDDLTGYLAFGGRTNVLAVRADTSAQPASRWYAGAGIYRHVRLRVVDPVHLEPWSAFIHGDIIDRAGSGDPAYTNLVGRVPSRGGTYDVMYITATQAQVALGANVANDSETAHGVHLQLEIAEANGRVVQSVKAPPQTALPHHSTAFSLHTELQNPQLWDVDHPALYQARLSVCEGESALDRETIAFGIREFHFDPATGFWLNGRNLKLKGVCLHGDGSCFGAAVPFDIWKSHLLALRALGVNAIRTAHNPPAREFLDLCDRLGFLVMDEFFDCWTVGKNPFDYHLYFTNWSKLDACDTIRRDRNHPSIILYSVGNEIRDTRRPERARPILAGLVEVCHENDPTRPVTLALLRPNASGDYTNGLADLLDVIGTNYRDSELLEAQRARPSRRIVGTEQRHDRATWLECRDHPSHSGQFLWTGVDYLGESRRWPIIAAGSGLLDRCGQPKPLAFQRQSWWSDSPMVYMARRITAEKAETGDPGFAPLDRRPALFSDWTPPQNDLHDETVEVYSNCEDVELLLNGRSLGRKPLPPDPSPRSWTVGFEPGELTALGRNQGNVAAQYSLRTAGAPEAVVLTANKTAVSADWDSVAEVLATITDARGARVPGASNIVTFAVAGPGVIAAVDSADNSSHEPFQAPRRRAFDGRCMVMIKASSSTGTIRLSAAAEGLKSGVLTISAAPEAHEPSL